MDKQDVLSLYKEQYAHELDKRDSINSSIQVRGAILATIITILVYVIRNIDLTLPLELLIGLGVITSVGIVLLCKAGYLLLGAYWENEYEYFPYANEVEETRQDMAAKGHFEHNPEVFTDFIIERFSSCAGQIAETNDIRQQRIGRMNRPFKQASILLVTVGLIFTLGDLDAASSRKDVSVSITNPPVCSITTTLTDNEQQ
ncbi:hypothetical protein MCT05_04350 [Vibrio aestuarianus]|nr:hypothetical protein [Vibrio aestuarianus]CAK3828610.1 SMODS and SLOG-associating 2TM effector domain-containing protein [Vibrio crassostreae]